MLNLIWYILFVVVCCCKSLIFFFYVYVFWCLGWNFLWCYWVGCLLRGWWLIFGWLMVFGWEFLFLLEMVCFFFFYFRDNLIVFLFIFFVIIFFVDCFFNLVFIRFYGKVKKDGYVCWVIVKMIKYWSKNSVIIFECDVFEILWRFRLCIV